MPRITAQFVFEKVVLYEGNVWTKKEREIFLPDDLKSGEGLGERSYRRRLGLDSKFAGIHSRVDIIERNHEVKCLQTQGIFDPRIRLGTNGKRVWSQSLMNRELITYCDDTISSGEFSISKLSPDQARRLRVILSPSNVLGGYDSLVLVSQLGFVVVNKRDFNRAFLITGVSQGSPRYKLDCQDYLLSRLPQYPFSCRGM